LRCSSISFTLIILIATIVISSHCVYRFALVSTPRPRRNEIWTNERTGNRTTTLPRSQGASDFAAGGATLPKELVEKVKPTNVLPVRIVSKRGPLGPGIPEQSSSSVIMITRDEHKWVCTETDPCRFAPKDASKRVLWGNPPKGERWGIKSGRSVPRKERSGPDLPAPSEAKEPADDHELEAGVKAKSGKSSSDEFVDDVFMVLKIRRLGAGVPDELYVDFIYKDAGWRGPYPLSTSAYDLMIDRMKNFKRWNEYGIDYGESTGRIFI
jgi:hypothetical protein